MIAVDLARNTAGMLVRQIPLVLAVAVAAAWWPVAGMPLLQDDFAFLHPTELYELSEQEYAQLERTDVPPWIWRPRAHQAYWRPLSQNLWLGYTMRRQAWPSEGRPIAAHLVSLAMLVACGELVRRWARAALALAGRKTSEELTAAEEAGALAVAVLFVTRPAFFIGAAWPSAQQELLALLFSGAAVLLLLEQRPSTSLQRILLCTISALLLVAALLCKETAVLFPFAVGPLVFLARRRGHPAPRAFFLPLALGLGIYSAARIGVYWATGAELISGLGQGGRTLGGLAANLAGSALLLLDCHRELLRNVRAGDLSAPTAAMSAVAALSLAFWVFLLGALRPNSTDEVSSGARAQRNLLLAGALAGAALATLPTALAPAPYGYYLMYAWAGVAPLVALAASRLPRCRGLVVVAALVALGAAGNLLQSVAPSGNYQRAVRAREHRAWLREAAAQNPLAPGESLEIHGFTRDEIWAMGWGFGIVWEEEPAPSSPSAFDIPARRVGGPRVSLIPADRSNDTERALIKRQRR